MIDNKPTDNEIVKALKQKIKFREFDESNDAIIKFDILENSLDLINRLQAEKDVIQHYINHLQKESEKLKNEKEAILKYHPSTTHPYEVITPHGVVFAKTEKEYDDFKKNIKAEAYKECIEKVKMEAENATCVYEPDRPQADNMVYHISNIRLDNLLKELVGDGNVG